MNQSFVNETQTDTEATAQYRSNCSTVLSRILESFVAVLKQPLANVLQNTCSYKCRNIQRKAPVLEFVFSKVAGLQLSCEDSKFFKNSFFHKTPLLAASENSLISQENRFVFLINTTKSGSRLIFY